MRNWQKWQCLSPLERRLLLQAWLLLPMVVVGLRLFGLRGCQQWLGRRKPSAESRPPMAEAERDRLLKTAGRMVRAAANRCLINATCLPQSLSLWWLLNRYGIVTELRIGVRKTAGQFEAHAWLEHQGQVVGDATVAEGRYQAFTPSFHPMQ